MSMYRWYVGIYVGNWICLDLTVFFYCFILILFKYATKYNTDNHSISLDYVVFLWKDRLLNTVQMKLMDRITESFESAHFWQTMYAANVGRSQVYSIWIKSLVRILMFTDTSPTDDRPDGRVWQDYKWIIKSTFTPSAETRRCFRMILLMMLAAIFHWRSPLRLTPV